MTDCALNSREPDAAVPAPVDGSASSCGSCAAQRRPWLPHAGAALLYFALALAVTFPLWLRPAATLESLGDPSLNAWILAWDRFALFHQVFAFFDANVFWPYAHSLAFGEHMLTQTILLLPFGFFSSAPAFLHNLSLFQAYFFSSLAAYALGWFYFRSARAATVAGLAYGFAACRVAQSGHVQLVHGEFLPLIVLAAEQILALRPAGPAGAGRVSRGWVWLLGLSALGQWLTSWYWAVFTLWCVGPLLALRLAAEGRGLRREGALGRRLVMLGAPLLAAALLVLPVAGPYLQLKAGGGMFRPPEVTASYSARPGDYLSAPGRSLLYGGLHPWAPDPVLAGERSLFPGVLPLVALIVALGAALTAGTRDRVVDRSFPLKTWVTVTALLLVFTCGPAWHWIDGAGGRHVWPLPYALAVRLLPVTDQIRVPARWILPAALGLALLLAWLWRKLFECKPWTPARRAAAALCGMWLVLECLARPMLPVPVARSPEPVWAWLERQPYPAPALLLPVEYDGMMLDAAAHHQPLLNGSNGYFPAGRRTLLRHLQARFPAPDTLDLLRALGVRYVIVDFAPQLEKTLPGAEAARLAEAAHRLAGNGASLPSHDFGRWLALDLGPGERDMGRIERTMEQATRAALQATQSAESPAP